MDILLRICCFLTFKNLRMGSLHANFKTGYYNHGYVSEMVGLKIDLTFRISHHIVRIYTFFINIPGNGDRSNIDKIGRLNGLEISP